MIRKRGLLFKGHTQQLKQIGGHGIVWGGGDNRNIHTLNKLHAVQVYLRKNDLLANTHGIITPAIKGLTGQSAEIPDSRDGNGYQAVQEFPHTGSP